MKVDFDAVLTDLRGRPLMRAAEPGEEGPVPLTLSWAVIEALMFVDPNARQSAEQKLKAFVYAQRVHDGGAQDWTPEDVSAIKAVIGAHPNFPPLIVGRAFELLNG